MNPGFPLMGTPTSTSFHFTFSLLQARHTLPTAGRAQPARGVPLLGLSLRRPRVGASRRRTVGAPRLPNERGLDVALPEAFCQLTPNSPANGHWSASGTASEPSDAAGGAGGRWLPQAWGSVRNELGCGKERGGLRTMGSTLGVVFSRFPQSFTAGRCTAPAGPRGQQPRKQTGFDDPTGGCAPLTGACERRSLWAAGGVRSEKVPLADRRTGLRRVSERRLLSLERRDTARGETATETPHHTTRHRTYGFVDAPRPPAQTGVPSRARASCRPRSTDGGGPPAGTETAQSSGAGSSLP